jgi:hypothetical protein
MSWDIIQTLLYKIGQKPTIRIALKRVQVMSVDYPGWGVSVQCLCWQEGLSLIRSALQR